MKHRRLALAGLVIYSLTLLTATHWPGLAIEGPIDRTDLVVHAGAFGLWTILLIASGLSAGRWAIALAAGLGFAAFDETTQPLFSRVFDWTDLGADAVGVVLAVAASLTLSGRFRGRGHDRGAAGP